MQKPLTRSGWYVPDAHGLQMSWFSWSWKLPASQPEQLRSEVVLETTDTNFPATQSEAAMQKLLARPGWYVPDAQGLQKSWFCWSCELPASQPEQLRSDEVLGSAVTYWPVAQFETARQKLLPESGW